MKPLHPGDRAYILQKGRRLRGRVGDYLYMPTRGAGGAAGVMVPFIRRKNVRWVRRDQLRKLPSKISL